MSQVAERLAHLKANTPAVVVDGRTVFGQESPTVTRMQFRPGARSVWENLYSIAENTDGTYWCRSYSHTYDSVPADRIRVEGIK